MNVEGIFVIFYAYHMLLYFRISLAMYCPSLVESRAKNSAEINRPVHMEYYS